MSQWWSWALGLVGVLGFVLAGQRIWWAWWINVAAQGLWYAYAVVTEQWGFFVSATVYTAVFLKNAVKWTRERDGVTNDESAGGGLGESAQVTGLDGSRARGGAGA